MGVNLVPEVDGFFIENKQFLQGQGDRSVDVGCISEGKHRVLRFNLYCHNKGDKDFVVGNPKERTDVFGPSPIYPWGQFKDKFYTFSLKRNGSIIREGYKVAFCLAGGPGFNCESNQGIAAGGRDTYRADLACQFIGIDNLPDGEYTLEVVANAPAVKAVKTGTDHVLPGFEEDNYDDNTVSVHLQLKGDSVQQV